MYRKIWSSSYQSVCRITFYADTDISISSVTGFKTGSYIVTDSSVYSKTGFKYVKFAFVGETGNGYTKEIRMNADKFIARCLPMVREANEGFALIDISSTELSRITGLLTVSKTEVPVGSSVAILCFNESQHNLSIKPGMVSSYHTLRTGGNEEFIQCIASINLGNEGAPVIDTASGKVIGIVGMRLKLLSMEYMEFKKIIDGNIELLQSVQGQASLGDLDPVQVLIATQQQLRRLGKEVYKRTHASYCYAHKIDNLSKYLS